MKKCDISLTELGNKFKQTDIYMIGIPEGAEKVAECLFEEIMAEKR